MDIMKRSLWIVNFEYYKLDIGLYKVNKGLYKLNDELDFVK